MSSQKSQTPTKDRKRTSQKAAKAQRAGRRLETGIVGLDTITGGGLLVGGTYLLLGSPGAGKTILANQIAFHGASKRKTLFVTLLAESHSRMFAHLDTLTFFDRTRISESVQYLSGYDVLEKEGIDGFMKLLAVSVMRHKADVLIVDGIASASDISDGASFKKFVHNLSSVVGISNCTTLLLSSVHHDRSRPEYTMVDGIISLTLQEMGMRSAREIEIQKFRGSQHLYGKHFFDITSDGVGVYPRIDSIIGAERRPQGSISSKDLSGTPGLDEALEGGFTQGSTTSLLGPAGTGKTSIGMSFLSEGARKKECGIYLSLYEHPQRVERKLQAIGNPISKYIKQNLISIVRRSPAEFLLDKLIYGLIEQIEATGAKRLFIDGLAGLKDSGFLGAERLRDILNSLAGELRFRDVTTLMVEETDASSRTVGTVGCLSFDSAIFDNVIQLSYAHLNATRIQTLNIVKTRESDHDSRFFQLFLTQKGPRLGPALEFLEPVFPVVRLSEV